MGRTASGVKGIELDNSYVIGAEVADSSKLILVITEKGYGKKTETDEYGKVQGDTVGKGVKIKFYITYHDELSDGDKLVGKLMKNT